MTLLINGHGFPVPGRVGVTLRDYPELALDRSDWRPRRRDEVVTGIVVHTRMGITPRIKAGPIPSKGWDMIVAKRWRDDKRPASAHIAVDSDGSFACLADLALVATYHAGHVNGCTVGIEMYQDADGGMYQPTIDATCDLIDVITREMGIQRQTCTETAICRRFANIDPREPRTYMPGGGRGRDFVGVYGHRNATRNRGPGDPGDLIFAALTARGYEPFAVDDHADTETWAERQRALGVQERDVDGIPGAHTRALIQSARHGGPGIWVERPCDLDFHPLPVA